MYEIEAYTLDAAGKVEMWARALEKTAREAMSRAQEFSNAGKENESDGAVFVLAGGHAIVTLGYGKGLPGWKVRKE